MKARPWLAVALAVTLTAPTAASLTHEEEAAASAILWLRANRPSWAHAEIHLAPGAPFLGSYGRRVGGWLFIGEDAAGSQRLLCVSGPPRSLNCRPVAR